MRPREMQIRRHLLRTCAVGAGTLACPALLLAQAAAAWPTRSVRLVVGLASGGLADVLTRALQPHLAEGLGQPVVIDNRGGAGGNLAAIEVIRNGGDGHTFLVAPTTLESINPVLYPTMGFDPARELQPVGLLANSHLFLIARPGLAAASLKDLAALARAQPGRLSYGSAGNGTTPHLAGELFNQSGGLHIVHVPYRGAAPAIQDVMAGQIDFTFGPGTVFPSVKAGRLKILAVASRQRAASYPEAPTFDEAGFPGVYADSMFGIYAPASMPAAPVARMSRELGRALELPVIQARFADLGAEALPLQPQAFRSRVEAETRLFANLVKERGIKPD